jgi:integrase
MSRTKKTEKEYYDRGLSLLRRAYIEASQDGHDFADHAIRVKIKNESIIVMDIFQAAMWAAQKWSKMYRPNTWSKYRCSIRFIGELFLKKNKITEDMYEKICYILDKTSAGDKRELEPQTSSHKKKTFSKKEVQAVEDFFDEGDYRWAKPTLYWIKAGVYLGLRPVEWKNSEYNEEYNVIIVQNAKNTNGRANGKTRTLSLKHHTEEEKNIILTHLNFSKKMKEDGKWDGYYQGCANLIKYSTRKIWRGKERLPTLYSGRHQYSANLKASGCKRNEVAALMGHGTDQTAAEHYGKKIHGTRKSKPEVNELDLQKVKKVRPYKFSFKNNKNKD